MHRRVGEGIENSHTDRGGARNRTDPDLNIDLGSPISVEAIRVPSISETEPRSPVTIVTGEVIGLYTAQVARDRGLILDPGGELMRAEISITDAWVIRDGTVIPAEAHLEQSRAALGVDDTSGTLRWDAFSTPFEIVPWGAIVDVGATELELHSFVPAQSADQRHWFNQHGRIKNIKIRAITDPFELFSGE